MKPSFIGIGAQKCASTWLYRILEAHPDVCVGSEKEINYFSVYYDRGYQWYERQFRDQRSSLAVGEISPSYFADAAVPKRVRAYAPDIKIILSLRDPVQRVLSNHRHEVRMRHFQGPDYSIEAGIENNPMYVEQGLYATHLKQWLRYFKRDQILVILMDDIQAAPSEVAEIVYKFIGVDSSFKPTDVYKLFNPSYANKWAWLNALKDSFYRLTRAPWLRWLWSLFEVFGFKSLYRKVNKVPSDQVIPSPRLETLTRLRQGFAPELDELEVMLERSLTSWRI